ncbi:MAG: exodeoxyribonuclease VII large subunit [Patescibacteria group bacterium]
MRILPVSEFIGIVNDLLRETLSGGEAFAVEGEVSNYRLSQGQWVTFDLKDDKGLLNVFMPAWNLNVPIEEGIKVRVYGVPRVYPKYGKFSLSAERLELAGEGELRKALLHLRERLTQEGLFAAARKRQLPRFPRRIALVASRESAAYGDFVRILNERWGGLEIDLYHVLVQGERAAQDIVRAIGQAQSGDYDALVMTRGGGSLEELMAFNDERVVRAIHGSIIPTLVAIGHERDITLAEEAADVRGSTPTDCARRLVPDRRDVLYEIATLVESVEVAMDSELERRRNVLERAMSAPSFWVQARAHELQTLQRRVVVGAESWLYTLKQSFDSCLRVVSSLDPKRLLARGYSIIRDSAGKYLTSVKDLKLGQEIALEMKDGKAGAEINKLPDGALQPKLL